MKKWIGVLLLLLGCACTARAELYHVPYGNNELYGSLETAPILWDRAPHAPVAGEPVTLYAAADGIDRARAVALCWRINGAQQRDILCSRYMETDGKTIYRAKLQPLSQGDQVTYWFCTENFSTEEYSFSVLDWVEGGCQRTTPQAGCLRLTPDPQGKDRPENGVTIRYLTDGESAPYAWEITFPALPGDQYLGFGMRYNAQDQRGRVIDHYTVNWYTDQKEKTYATVPFFLCSGRYGFYADTDAYVRFDMAKESTERVKVYMELPGEGGDVYLFAGTNPEISALFADTAGHAAPLPEWAYGVWLSANEWDKQSEAEAQLALAREHGIDVAALVLEAWSDEVTFYRFSERFPAPKALVDAAHAQGTRVILWQIPVLKCTAEGNAASRADEIEAIQKGYVVSQKDGKPYRMPDGWFGNSLLIDFTNPKAVAWFLEKRRYLVDEVGVDGFKTDGGEFVWGMEAVASNGLSGRALRNAYPDLYAVSYQDVLDTLSFSRAAGRYAHRHSLLWAGDQRSTFDEFQGCVRAILNMNISGMPFVTFDIAGFSGELPTAELYQRAVAFAAFTPVMQVHSEASGDPLPSRARTPWNMAQCKNDPLCLETFRKYAKINGQLRPYLLDQAQISCRTGIPLLRSMAYAFPEDGEACRVEYQFMLGDRYLVAPVVKPRVTEWPVYLPAGEWRDYFTGKIYQGERWILSSAKVDEIPVFERIAPR